MAVLKKRRDSTSLAAMIILEAALLFFVLIINIPFFWMISTSLKIESEVLAYPPKLIPSVINLNGYKYIWTLVPFARYFINTVFVSVSIAVSKIVLASLAAYAFAKIPFKGKNTIFYIFLGTMMIPMEVIIIPNYITLNAFGWLDTYWALIIPFIVGAFSIFLLRQFFMQIPKDLDDAAVLDGCSRIRYLFTIIYPLSKPALLTVGLYAFLASWNSFLWPLIVTNSDSMRVIQIALKALQDSWMIDWTSLTAASTIATVPIIIVFFFVQKQFLEGIAITGLKG